MRPRMLDLFCGPGGAGTGYYRAGFDVVGVDKEPQPDYPFEFHQADALEYLAAHGHEFDAVHASPPCTEHSTLTRADADRHDPTGTADLLPRTLAALAELPHGAWVVENVMGARMPTDIVLCGAMFGLRVYRHRRFTIGPAVPLLSVPPHPRHRRRASRGGDGMTRREAWAAGQFMTVTGDASKCGAFKPIFGQAMGIDWIAGDGISLAIPPAYTEYIGGQLIEALERAA